MKIDRLKLHNYKGFKEIEFEFHNKLNIFIGNNGTGKSAILNSMAIMLSWLVARIQRERGNGKKISDDELHNNTNEGSINMQLSYGNRKYNWMIAQTRKWVSSEKKSSYEDVSELAAVIRNNYSTTAGLPVIAYYPISRTVNQIIPNITNSSSISDIDIYEDALTGNSNYQSFFEWFRYHDDIINEEFSYQTEWLQRNTLWIRKQFNTILNKFPIIKPNTVSDTELFLISEKINGNFVFEDLKLLLILLPRYIYSRVTDRGNIDISTTLNAIADMTVWSHKGKYDFFFYSIEKTYRSLQEWTTFDSSSQFKDNENDFMWEFLSFAILCGLWQLNDKSWQKIIKFFDNQKPFTKNSYEFVSYLQDIFKNDIHMKNSTLKNKRRELQLVRKAIENFVPEYKNLKVKREPHPHMVLDKGDEVLNLNQLSDGEKNLIALVGDIARRLTMVNSHKKEPLHGEGIILIDEIDLHLHPSWQRIVIPKMIEIFPNCQFFISTHSPQVISSAKSENIFLLRYLSTGIEVESVEESYGMSIDRVVVHLMDDYSRSVTVQGELDKLFELIERKQTEKAKILVKELKKDMSQDPDIIRAEMLIHLQEQKV